ncbi:hypothetical protein ABPG75_003197 [Micractinium tetrahymenae]
MERATANEPQPMSRSGDGAAGLSIQTGTFCTVHPSQHRRTRRFLAAQGKLQAAGRRPHSELECEGRAQTEMAASDETVKELQDEIDSLQNEIQSYRERISKQDKVIGCLQLQLASMAQEPSGSGCSAATPCSQCADLQRQLEAARAAASALAQGMEELERQMQEQLRQHKAEAAAWQQERADLRRRLAAAGEPGGHACGPGTCKYAQEAAEENDGLQIENQGYRELISKQEKSFRAEIEELRAQLAAARHAGGTATSAQGPAELQSQCEAYRKQLAEKDEVIGRLQVQLRSLAQEPSGSGCSGTGAMPCSQEVEAKTAALVERLQHEATEASAARGRVAHLQSLLLVRAREAQRMERAIMEEREESDQQRRAVVLLQRKAGLEAAQRQAAEAAWRKNEEAAAAREYDLQDLLHNTQEKLEAERGLRAAAEREAAARHQALEDERDARAAAEAKLSALMAKRAKALQMLAEDPASDAESGQQEDTMQADHEEPEPEPQLPAAAAVQQAGRGGRATRSATRQAVLLKVTVDQQPGGHNQLTIAVEQQQHVEPAELAGAPAVGAAPPCTAVAARRCGRAAGAAAAGEMREARGSGPAAAAPLAAGSGQEVGAAAAATAAGPGKAKANGDVRSQLQADALNEAVRVAFEKRRDVPPLTNLEARFAAAARSLPDKAKADFKRAWKKGVGPQVWHALYGGGAETKDDMMKDMRRVGFPRGGAEPCASIYTRFMAGARQGLEIGAAVQPAAAGS